MIVLLSPSGGRQAKGLRHSSRGHRPRKCAIIKSLRPVRALHPFDSGILTGSCLTDFDSCNSCQAPKILNPFQPLPKLSKPFQGPPEGRGSVVGLQSLRHARTRLVPAKLNLGYFNQIKVILGKFSLFQEKKDCLFFYLAGGWFRSILLLKEKNGDTPNLIL
jgi:hypothetical protein